MVALKAEAIISSRLFQQVILPEGVRGMARIILASESKARQELLKQIGLDFSVIAPAVKEKRVLKSKRNTATADADRHQCLNSR